MRMDFSVTSAGTFDLPIENPLVLPPMTRDRNRVIVPPRKTFWTRSVRTMVVALIHDMGVICIYLKSYKRDNNVNEWLSSVQCVNG